MPPFPPPESTVEPAPDTTSVPSARLEKRRRTGNKPVDTSPAQLESEFAQALASKGSPEIVVAHLINKYNFDIKTF